MPGLEPGFAVLETAASPSMLHSHRTTMGSTLGAANPSPSRGGGPSDAGEDRAHGGSYGAIRAAVQEGWCPPRDSNPQLSVSETAASTNFARRAWWMGSEFAPTQPRRALYRRLSSLVLSPSSRTGGQPVRWIVDIARGRAASAWPPYRPDRPGGSRWSRRRDSNPRPSNYENAALAAELRRLGGSTGSRTPIPGMRHRCSPN